MNVGMLVQSNVKEEKLFIDCQEKDAILYCMQKADTEPILKASVAVFSVLAFHLLDFTL